MGSCKHMKQGSKKVRKTKTRERRKKKKKKKKKEERLAALIVKRREKGLAAWIDSSRTSLWASHPLPHGVTIMEIGRKFLQNSIAQILDVLHEVWGFIYRHP